MGKRNKIKKGDKMSVNVRWKGRGWPGKVPRSPVAPPEGRRG
jgi:hypothetical protein